jgi:hypothetical protein
MPPEVEQSHFNRMVGLPTERVRIQAKAVAEGFIDPVRDQRPAARDPAIVRTGREMLAVLRTAQERTRAQIVRIHPYPTPAVETARGAAVGYLDAALALTGALDACLASGPNWNRTSHVGGAEAEPDELRLQQLANDATEADLRWRKAARVVISMKPSHPDNRQFRSPPSVGPRRTDPPSRPDPPAKPSAGPASSLDINGEIVYK